MSTEQHTLKPIDGAPACVLVVDDEEALCQVVSRLCEMKGLKCMQANTAEKALIQFKEGQFGLCVFDIMIPRVNGLKLAQQYRQTPKGKQTPLVFISGAYGEADMNKVKAAFPNSEVLSKPFDAEMFNRLLDLAFPGLDEDSEPEATAEPEAPADAEDDESDSFFTEPEEDDGKTYMPGELGYDLKVDHDEMVVTLTSAERGPDSIRSREMLEDALAEEKVCQGINQKAIGEAFRLLPELTRAGLSVVIARGKKALPGKDGSIDFKVDVSGRATYQTENESGGERKIDFKEAVSVTMVRAGEILAVITPPTEGVPGYSLTGKEIKPRKAKTAYLRPGEGVECDATELVFKATQDGRPFYMHGTIAVSATYEVRGDVDFSTGNIHFNGHVHVSGNMQDDFSIECTSAEIDGTVGACTISCGGDLIVRGGINGREKAEITVGGTFESKYVNQATLTVSGDCIIHRELVNCRLWSLGKVTAGKLIGGTTVSLLGLQVKQLGSELGVATTVRPGENFRVLAIEEDLAALAEQIHQIVKPVETFFGNRPRFKSLPEDKQAEFRANLETFLSLKEKHQALAKQRREILEASNLQPIKEVVIWETVFTDVLVRTQSCMKHFKNPLTGPLALIEDMERGTIRPASYVPGKGIQEEEEE